MRISDWSSDVCASDLSPVGSSDPDLPKCRNYGSTRVERAAGQRRRSVRAESPTADPIHGSIGSSLRQALRSSPPAHGYRRPDLRPAAAVWWWLRPVPAWWPRVWIRSEEHTSELTS